MPKIPYLISSNMSPLRPKLPVCPINGRPSVSKTPYLVSSHKSSVRPKLPVCPICRESVALEISKADEDGNAIHEQCYVLRIGLKATTTPAKL